MADEKKRPVSRRPLFLIFCLYMACYAALRFQGEMVHQVFDFRAAGGAVARDHMVGSDSGLPRWRRQLYRVVFSPLMVAEEEGRRLLAQSGDLVRGAGDYGRGLFGD